jgi:4-amino-4-deoxychorismate lyase
VLKRFWADETGLPAADRGLAYGDGLFETIRAEGSSAPWLDYHLARLVRDAARLGIAVRQDELLAASREALERYGSPGKVWVLKLILTRGAGGRGYRPGGGMEPNLLVSCSDAPPVPDSAGVVAEFSSVPLTVNPLLAGIKSLSRLEQVMAARELSGGCFEVLMADAAGHIVEGTRTNLFVLTAEGWITPPANTVAVAGVMRQLVIERLQQAGEPLKETPVTRAQLQPGVCRGLFLTNSVLGVVAVRKLANQDLPAERCLATICRFSTTLE